MGLFHRSWETHVMGSVLRTGSPNTWHKIRVRNGGKLQGKVVMAGQDSR